MLKIDSNKNMPIISVPADAIKQIIPASAQETLAALWTSRGLPLFELKVQDTLTGVAGVIFSMAGFRFDHRRRRSTIERFLNLTGHRDKVSEVETLADQIEDALHLLSHPVEGLAMDLGANQVREAKIYFRTNIANERSSNSILCGDPTPPELDDRVARLILNTVLPERQDAALAVLTAMHGFKMSLEMVGLDYTAKGETEIKLYAYPHHHLAQGKAQPQDLTFALLETVLDSFGLIADLPRAIQLDAILRQQGLAPNFMGIELLPPAGSGFKLYYSARHQGARYMLPLQQAEAALRNVFESARMPTDQAAIDSLMAVCRRTSLGIDSFSIDFSPRSPRAKAYLRPLQNQGGGILPLDEDKHP